MDEARAETTEVEVSPEQQEMRHWLDMAASYLSQALATRTEAATPEDRPQMIRQVKLSAAQLQLRMLGCFLHHYRLASSRKEATWQLHHLFRAFWREYQHLAIDHFEQALTKLGHDPTKMDPQIGLRAMRGLRQGVKGAIAVCAMATNNGFDVKLPTPEEDVDNQTDLILKKGDLMVPVQVKCETHTNFSVEPEPGNPKVVRVNVPGMDMFYQKPDLGIPHHSHIAEFARLLERHLRAQK